MSMRSALTVESEADEKTTSPAAMDKVAALLGNFPFDVLLGSVHWIPTGLDGAPPHADTGRDSPISPTSTRRRVETSKRPASATGTFRAHSRCHP